MSRSRLLPAVEPISGVPFDLASDSFLAIEIVRATQVTLQLLGPAPMVLSNGSPSPSRVSPSPFRERPSDREDRETPLDNPASR
jgi:hypothetical protein